MFRQHLSFILYYELPLADCQVTDPRIRRTRQLLQGALQTLMETKGIDEITVQDVTEAATVNRATFYDHYPDKYALLEATVAGGFHRLLRERGIAFDGTCRDAMGAVVLAACDFLTQMHAKGSCERQNAFEPLMDAAIVTAIRRVLLPGIDSRPKPALETAMIASSASCALYGAVKQWFGAARRPVAERVVPQVIDLIWPMIEKARELERGSRRKPGLGTGNRLAL